MDIFNTIKQSLGKSYPLILKHYSTVRHLIVSLSDIPKFENHILQAKNKISSLNMDNETKVEVVAIINNLKESLIQDFVHRKNEELSQINQYLEDEEKRN